jgi:hypothetical protein
VSGCTPFSRHLVSALSFLIVVLLNAPAAGAQTVAGRVSGSIVDATGAVLPGVSVTATDVETGRQHSTTTNGDGQYVLYPLATGTYDIQATLDKFQPHDIRGLRVNVADVIVRNIVLTLGQSTEHVTVVGNVSGLQQGPSVASVINAEQVVNLPLNGRDYNQLVLLAGGAVENIGSGNGRDFGAAAANGNRAFSNDYLLDGAPNNDIYQGRSAIPLSVDTIREFKVTSSVAPAEFGQAGTQVSVVTRSGTNLWHGGVFEYYRGNALEARNPFSDEDAKPFSRHQFGGSIGGPVMLGIPGGQVYDGHGRTFFFFNYEGNRERQDVLRVATVPPDAFWQGDFSSLLARATPIQLRDPLAPGRPPIPGNRLDLYLNGARLSPTAARLRPFWGSPTREGLSNNAIRFARDEDTANQFSARIDHTLPRSGQLAMGYTDSRTEGASPSLLGTGGGLLTPIDTRNLTISYTQPIGARTVNELRVAVARYDSLTIYDDGGLPTVAELGLPGFEPADDLIPPMPRITFSGVDAFTQLNYGNNANFGMAALKKVSETVTIANALTMTRGRHVIKTGVEARLTHLDALQQTNARGQISFSPSATSTSSTGYPFADFLMGIPSSTTEVAVKRPVSLRQTEVAIYAQDDWRAGSRWLITAGLRNEIYLSPTEENYQLAIFDPTTGAIVVATDDGRLPTEQFLPSIVARLYDGNQFTFPLLSDVEAGLKSTQLLKAMYLNLGPRAGIAHQIDEAGRLVVRGGYGIFYTRYPAQYLLQTIAINPPFAGTFAASQQFTNGTPLLTLDRPYPATGARTSFSPAGFDREFVLPWNHQWNVTIERELTRGTTVSASYIGNRGSHLFRSVNMNGPRLDPSTGQITRAYSDNFATSSILVRRTDGRSLYHSMVLEVRRRAGNNLQFQGNWTWAKGLDDTGETVQSALLDLEDLGRDWADSDYVRRHMLKVNATWLLPFGRGQRFGHGAAPWLNALIGDWRLSAIWQFATGRYFTPTFSSSGGLSNSRPDRIGDGNLRSGERSPERWFDPSAFAVVPAADPATGLPRFGNSGRNVLIGPGLHVVDATLAKSVRLQGRSRLTLRIEAFNLFNTPNYDLPERNLSNTNTVGAISGLTRAPRQLQFAARLDF